MNMNKEFTDQHNSPLKEILRPLRPDIWLCHVPTKARLPRVLLSRPRVDGRRIRLSLLAALMDGAVVEPPSPHIPGHCDSRCRQGKQLCMNIPHS